MKDHPGAPRFAPTVWRRLPLLSFMDDGEAIFWLVAAAVIVAAVAAFAFAVIVVGGFLIAGCVVVGTVFGAGVAVHNFVLVLREAHAKII